MNKKALAAKAEVVDEKNIKWHLEYYVQIFDNGSGQCSYGIGIEGRNSKEDKSGKIFSEFTQGGITQSYETAKEWAGKLAQGLVFPAYLHEYVDDFVYGYENNFA